MRARSLNELESLMALSARIGCDSLLTQASAGNTSMKIDGCLWIKASGKWLADALQDDIFLPLSHSDARSCVWRQRAIKATAISSSGEELRPSAEVAMHAVLPQRVVVHVHSINTLARAVRLDGRAHLEALLRGLPWAWIPYVPSPLALAFEIDQVLGRPSRCDILILENHGLIVCGDTCEAVERLLNQVELRLGAVPRRAPRYDSKFLLSRAHGTRWKLPEQTRLHCLATDKISWDFLANGNLCAVQAVLLRGSHPWRPLYSGLYSEAVRHGERTPDNAPFLLFRDKGVLLSETITRNELEALIGLAEVVQRLDGSAPIRYLTQGECEQLGAQPICASRATPHPMAMSA